MSEEEDLRWRRQPRGVDGRNETEEGVSDKGMYGRLSFRNVVNQAFVFVEDLMYHVRQRVRIRTFGDGLGPEIQN